MSDLQLALGIAGIVLVAGVIGYNKWQEIRFRRRADEALKPAEADVLVRSSARTEPAITPVAPAVARVEPTLAEEPHVPSVPEPAVHEAAAVAQPPALSELLDFIVVLECAAPVTGQAVGEAAGPALASARRQVHVEGQGAGGWEPVHPDANYAHVRVGLQTVDRRGRASDEELRGFAGGVAQLAARIGARPVSGDLEQARSQARLLDGLCEQVDIQIVVHLVKRDGRFAGTKIRSMAEAAGLALEEDGRFRMRDEEGLEIFTLSNEEPATFAPATMKSITTASLALGLDVPRASPHAMARFQDFSGRLAESLEGVLVDDNQAPFGPAAFDAIATQLQPVYELMQQQGIPAGSPLARRLFS
jgi:hypothetical protein